MSSDFTLRTVVEYLALPELEIPTIPDEAMAGRICYVLSVDFYIALKADCDRYNLPAMEIPQVERCALPTVVVDINDHPIFFRLPHSLAEWTFDMVQRQSGGEDIFPAFVDFGIIRDQHFARFL